jgi:hypothetical protein
MTDGRWSELFEMVEDWLVVGGHFFMTWYILAP